MRRGARAARVLVTRPQPDAAATLKALAALGLEGLAAPLHRVERLPRRPLPPAALLLLTSRNAVRAIADRRGLKALPTFCVGDSTAALAREVGFARVVSAGSDAAGLARLVAARCDPKAGSVLLPTAPGAGLPLAAALRAKGFRVHRRTVYRIVPARQLPGPARRALLAGEIGWVLFHAGSAAGLFARLVRKAGLAERVRDVEAVALSGAAAKPLGTLPWRKTSWPAQPTEAAMLAILRSRQRRQARSRGPSRPARPSRPTRSRPAQP